MFYYGHRWRYNSQIGTCCSDDSEGEGCPLPSSSARSLQESLRPCMQETRPWMGREAGDLGSRSLPCSPMHCGPAGLPLSAKERERKTERKRENTPQPQQSCVCAMPPWPRLYSVAITHCLCVGIDPRLDTPWRSPGTQRSLIPQINAIGIPGPGLCL